MTVNEATTTVTTRTTMLTINISLVATTNYEKKRRRQKQRKITKPETKQVEMDDRSISSENNEQEQGKEQI